jgi:hypothetical protein
MSNRKQFGWRKMPVSWQKEPDFQKKIRAADQGSAIAALKIYIAICLKAEYYETERLPAGSAQLSLTALCNMLDLSRPMVVAGINLLVKWGVVARIRARPTILQIVEFESASYWVKLPTRPMYGSKCEDAIETLIHLPNRRRSTLHALQLYLYLASIRDKASNKASLSFDHGTKTLGISRNQFSAAVSLLAENLVTVRTAMAIKDETGQKFSSNQYWLRGSEMDPYRPSPLEAFAKGLDSVVNLDDALGVHGSQVVEPTKAGRLVDSTLTKRGPLAVVLDDD